MDQEIPLITIQLDLEAALERAMSALEEAGLKVMRSFDLSATRSVHTHCACPHHGTEQCDCHMVILLIYGTQNSPFSLVVHGYDGSVNFVLVSTRENDSDRRTEGLIRGALAPQNFPGFNQMGWANPM